MTMNYVELHASSAFSFLRGGSFPEQLAAVAAELEMPAMALLDRNGVYGAQRFSVAAREQNVRPIIGCELSMEDRSVLPVLVENRTGYKNLCEADSQDRLSPRKVRERRMHSPTRYKRALPRIPQIAPDF
jgi:error-prone DNA polymerase